MRKVISMFILVLMLISCLAVPTFAAVPPTADPMWDNANSVNGTMGFSGENKTTGEAKMQVIGKTGVTRIESSVVVYKHVGSDWVYVTENSKNVNLRSCTLTANFSGEIGYEYKAEFHFVVYKGTVGEVIDETVTKVCGA